MNGNNKTLKMMINYQYCQQKILKMIIIIISITVRQILIQNSKKKKIKIS